MFKIYFGSRTEAVAAGNPWYYYAQMALVGAIAVRLIIILFGSEI